MAALEAEVRGLRGELAVRSTGHAAAATQLRELQAERLLLQGRVQDLRSQLDRAQEKLRRDAAGRREMEDAHTERERLAACVADLRGRAADAAPAAVTSLADGVLGAMRRSALKTATVLVVAGLGVGLAVAGVWSRAEWPSHAPARVVTDTPPTPKVGGEEKGKAPAGGAAGDPPPKAGPYGFVARGATVKDGDKVRAEQES